MKKKAFLRTIVTLMLTMFMLGTAGTDVSAGTRFFDVSPSHPYYKGVMWATGTARIANGYPMIGMFGVDDTCTRGQAMMFLWKLAGKPTPNTSVRMPFRDVPVNHAYYRAILWGAQSGITKGFGDGTFGIDKKCTRGQIMTFIWRYKGHPAPSSSKYPFRDTPTSAYRNAIKWAAEKQITKGFSDRKFHDTYYCTRGQIVTFLFRMASRIGSSAKVSVQVYKAPTKKPTPTPTKKPTKKPTPTPTKAPTPLPTKSPTPTPVPVTVPGQTGWTEEPAVGPHTHVWEERTRTVTIPEWCEEVYIEGYDEEVLVKPAWVEKELVKDAWDEDVYHAEPWDEEVRYGVYECTRCGYQTESGSDITYHCGTCQGLGSNFHSAWAYTTVHHEAGTYETVHHKEEYNYIYHDDEYKTVHHDGYYETVYHDEETSIETYYVCACGEEKAQ